MVCDVRRAYVYAPAKRNMFMELPTEDVEAKPGEVGWLNVSLYGTRDAARNWSAEYIKTLVDAGLVRGRANP